MLQINPTKKLNKINIDGIVYSINEVEKTANVANVFHLLSTINEIFFPCSINYNTNEYTVISISEHAFLQVSTIRSVKFAPDSKLQMIEKKSFEGSSIESISIPPHLTIIGEHAFDNCRNLKIVEIPSNSELQVIEREAFSNTSIEIFTIPPHLTKICELTFSDCKKLKRIEISQNSELQTIEEYSFFWSNIECITIPPSCIELKDGWCCEANNLKKINIMPNNPYFSYLDEKFIVGKSNRLKDVYDILLFARRDIKDVVIPSFIESIGPYAFENCKKIRTIKFTSDSKLTKIGKYAFIHSKIESISFPSSLTQIGKKAFYQCKQLQKIEIPNDSNLLSFNDAFSETAIINFSIPLHLTQIDDNAFHSCYQLQRVQIPEYSELQIIKEKAFSFSSIESIFIPSSVLKLEEGWCDWANKLFRISVSENNEHYSSFNKKFVLGKSSSLDNYDTFVFAGRDIEKIIIPSFIRIIDASAFSCCTKLRKIEIPFNSELQEIKRNAFSHSSIKSLFIPSHVTKIDIEAFVPCIELKLIEIDENSKLLSFKKKIVKPKIIRC